MPMVSHEVIDVIANVGIAGDRYATGQGFYTGVSEWDAHVTLIQQEPFDILAAEHGVSIEPGELRRNLVTRGIDLDALIGRRFRIGGQAVLRGRKAWPPCAHIVKHSGRVEIFKFLARQCGIGADVLVSGTIRVGDPIVVESGPDDV
jgi:MOSC domain-containing protein YiiM